MNLFQKFVALLAAIGTAVISIKKDNILIAELNATVKTQGDQLKADAIAIADLNQQLNDAGATKAALQAAKDAQTQAEANQRAAEDKLDELATLEDDADQAQVELTDALAAHPNTPTLDPETLEEVEPGEPPVEDTKAEVPQSDPQNSGGAPAPTPEQTNG